MKAEIWIHKSCVAIFSDHLVSATSSIVYRGTYSSFWYNKEFNIALQIWIDHLCVHDQDCWSLLPWNKATWKQGRIQDFYNGVSINKKLQEGESAADNINFTGLYAEVGDMYLCVPQTGVQSTLSMLNYYRGLGSCSQQKLLKIRCQKSEFCGISATKITCII